MTAESDPEAIDVPMQYVLEQSVRSVSGTAIGVIGADVHVFGDGIPVYLLRNWRAEAAADSEWLRRMPSRMLSARFAVVPFTGRARALGELRGWRDDDRDRLTVRWLYSEGGSGKTRLAERLCADSAAEGWKVVTAIHGPGNVTPPPDIQDLTADGMPGLLVLVDYADRWPESHLAWLLSNSLFYRPGLRVRVLMVSRTLGGVSPLRDALARQQIEVSDQYLPPLRFEPDSDEDRGDAPGLSAGNDRAPPGGSGPRAEMFRAARTAFARYYGITDSDAEGIRPPLSLDHADMGLVLTVHVASLVAVDAHHHRQPLPPSGYAGLTLYLLDREYRHWALLAGDGTHELNPAERTHQTPPPVMQRAAFTAALTGPLLPDRGIALLGEISLVNGDRDASQVLADHSQCYPSPTSADRTVLEPLYPDRLAEDFLALTLPGHSVAYPQQEWAGNALTTLLARSDADQKAPSWTPRALTFLIAAADRWEHVRSGHLYPLLRQDPRLAVDGGSAALIGLADLRGVPPRLLTTVKREFSSARHPDLQTGMAAVVERLAPFELSRALTAAGQARVHHELWSYLTDAGQYQKSVAVLGEAVAIYRRLSDPGMPTRLSRRLVGGNTDEFKFQLAKCLINLSNDLSATDEPGRALAAAEESLPLLREISVTTEAFTPELAAALRAKSWALALLHRDEEALAVAHEIVGIRRRQGEEYPFTIYPWMTEHFSEQFTLETIQRDRFLSDSGGHHRGVADSLTNLAIRQAQSGSYSDAVASMSEGLGLLFRLSEADPGRHQETLAIANENYATMLSHVGRHRDAAAAAALAVDMLRRLASVNSGRYEPGLAHALGGYAQRLEKLGRLAEAVTAAREGFELQDRRAATPAEAATAAGALAVLATLRGASGDHDRGVADAEEAVARLQVLASRLPSHDADDSLAAALSKLAQVAERAGQHERSLAADDEHASIERRIAARNGSRSTRLDRRNLAAALSDRTASLSKAGRGDEALASSEEALAIFRELAAEEPAAYDPEVARVAGNIASVLTEADRHKDALPFAEESVSIYRRLASAEPTTYNRHLARTLDTLDTALHGLGHNEEAAAALQEAAGVLRLLAEAQPGTYLADLASALKYLGFRQKKLGRFEEALTATNESAELYRRLSNADPGQYASNLADVVSYLGIDLSAAGQPEPALAATQEAIRIYRDVIAAGTGEHREELADELRRLAGLLVGLQRHQEAITAADEAVALYRELTVQGPALAEALGYVGLGAWQTGQMKLAIAAMEEALTIAQRLAVEDPSQYSAAVASMRDYLAIFQTASNEAANPS